MVSPQIYHSNGEVTNFGLARVEHRILVRNERKERQLIRDLK